MGNVKKGASRGKETKEIIGRNGERKKGSNLTKARVEDK